MQPPPSSLVDSLPFIQRRSRRSAKPSNKLNFPEYTKCKSHSGFALFDLNQTLESTTDRELAPFALPPSDNLSFDWEYDQSKTARPLYNQGNKRFLTSQYQNLRRQIRYHSGVVSIIHEFWDTLPKDEDDHLHFAEYATFYRNLIQLLQPDIYPEDANYLLLDDWRNDTGGFGAAYMTKEQFEEGMFALADKWTNSVDARKFKSYTENWRRLREIDFKKLLFMSEPYANSTKIYDLSNAGNTWSTRDLHTSRSKDQWKTDSVQYLRNQMEIQNQEPQPQAFKSRDTTPKSTVLQKPSAIAKETQKMPPIYNQPKRRSSFGMSLGVVDSKSQSIVVPKKGSPALCVPVALNADLIMSKHIAKIR